jgi:hypothetical protein
MYGHGQRAGVHWWEECSKEMISIPLSGFGFIIFGFKSSIFALNASRTRP